MNKIQHHKESCSTAYCAFSVLISPSLFLLLHFQTLTATTNSNLEPEQAESAQVKFICPLRQQTGSEQGEAGKEEALGLTF